MAERGRLVASRVREKMRTFPRTYKSDHIWTRSNQARNGSSVRTGTRLQSENLEQLGIDVPNSTRKNLTCVDMEQTTDVFATDLLGRQGFLQVSLPADSSMTVGFLGPAIWQKLSRNTP